MLAIRRLTPGARRALEALRLRLVPPRRRAAHDAGMLASMRAERDHYYQVLTAAAADAIFTTGEDGVLTFFNEGAERLTGYEAGEVVGVMHGIQLHVREEVDAVAAELGVRPGREVFVRLAMAGPDTREWTFVRKDGSHVRVLHTVTTQRDAIGEVVGFVGLAHDISARHRAEQELRASELRFRALSEHAPVGIVQTDARGACWYANRRFCELLGLTDADVRGDGWLRALRTGDGGEVLDRFTRTLETGAGFDGELRVVRSDGATVHIRATAGPIRGDDGAVTGFVATVQDISDRVGVQRRLSESQQLFRSMLENVAVAAVHLDQVGRVVYCNPSLAAMLGRRPADVVGRDWFAEIVPPERAATRERYLEAIRGEIHLAHHENQVLTASGSRRLLSWSSIVTRDSDGAATGMIGLGQDVTDRRRAEQRASHLAYHDALTGLPNRAAFADQLAAGVAEAERGEAAVAVLFADVDAFKLVNDSLGHAAGDELLRLIAGRLAAVTRAADIIARQSGDEFLVLVRDPNGTRGDVAQLAEALAARIEHALTAPFSVADQEVVIGVSVGRSIHPHDGRTAEELLHHADVEMYAAKSVRQGGSSRGRSSDDPARDLHLAAALHHAIRRGELVLHYQPIVELAGGSVTGVEALVRWDRGGELIRPDLFLPAAERTGLLTPITHWVVAEAVRQLDRWHAVGTPFDISLNLPPAMLDARMRDRLIRVATENAVAPGRITLELVESAMMDDSDLIEHLDALRTAGYRIAIDDFGSGHSSLARIGQLPVDVVKIDRSLIAEVCDSHRGRAIVRAIIATAEALSADVVAEGIETERQRTALRDLGVGNGQGYLFARPMGARELQAHTERAA